MQGPRQLEAVNVPDPPASLRLETPLEAASLSEPSADAIRYDRLSGVKLPAARSGSPLIKDRELDFTFWAMRRRTAVGASTRCCTPPIRGRSSQGASVNR